MERRGSMDAKTCSSEGEPTCRVTSGILPRTTAQTEFTTYCRLVWSLFCAHRRSEFPLISPAEFDVMRRWREQGVAVRHVDQALEQTNAKGRRLDYYEKPVLAEARRAMRALSL